ncbi:O-antigen ligase family protein [Coraliomargarita sp. SDUM461003]|uniref:O-antigen ligase family protein n=1 Tax=Thalassobacterium maritimum TaxID=3041265 RepID=A0ABU1AYC8_9BACT|nr:O-antigen ligase family protein [Coraliomargarita sp. SDUM461003]MDQ8209168.1 O-antigen ligase family protein [Coraliomargarita sp. SDUM461003]
MKPSSVSVKRSQAQPISRREWLVACSGGLTLAFTAWGLGGVEMWTLHVLLAGGLFTFICALAPWPSRQSESMQQTGGAPVKRFLGAAFNYLLNVSAAKRLLRFPFFWLSFIFLLYLLIGACNPSAEIVRDERGWWVEAMPATIALWLPTSVQSDYQPMNAWRVLVSFTASFSLVWGLWAGLTRRKTTLLVLWCLLLSGGGMAMVAILQHLTEAKEVLWTFSSSNENFWGSFFYRNQGAAYLNLVLVVAAFLFFYHAIKTRQHLRSGGPHFLCLFLFLVTAISVGSALSRGGIVFGLVLCLAFAGLLVIYGVQALFHSRSFLLGAFTFAGLLAAGYGAFLYIDLQAIEERFGDVEQSLESGGHNTRAISTRATWDMAQDRLRLGWGAGSFRYIFPMYQREYPDIYYAYYHSKSRKWFGRKSFRYAHNDLVQFVAEYGIVGTSLVFGGILLLLLQAFFSSRGQLFAVLILLAGAVQAFGHAFFDFIFNSPAYWMAFLGLLVAATKLLRLESAKKSQRRSQNC